MFVELTVISERALLEWKGVGRETRTIRVDLIHSFQPSRNHTNAGDLAPTEIALSTGWGLLVSETYDQVKARLADVSQTAGARP